MTSTRRIAVVTGASSGIGLATAQELARRGFHVLAGVRRQQDADRIASESIEPVILDITDEERVAVLAERVANDPGGRRLGVLVNNAGVALNAPVEVQSWSDSEQRVHLQGKEDLPRHVWEQTRS